MEQCPKCSGDNFEKYQSFYEEQRLVEYSLRCDNCYTHIATWSYGTWFPNEDFEKANKE